MDMTHPDILAAEDNGYPALSEEPLYECIMCDYPIYAYDYFYDTPDGPVCEDCDVNYMQQYNRRMA